MPNLTDQLARSALDHQIDLLRVAANANREVQALLSLLQTETAARLLRSNLSASALSRLSAVLRDVRKAIEEGFGGIDDVMTNRLAGLTETETALAALQVNNAVGVSLMEGVLPKATMLALYRDTLILGAPSSEWWLRQAAALAFNFAKQIRLGMATGETNAQLVARVRALDGLFAGTRRQAEALVRTSVQTVANAARVAAMEANSDVLSGYQQMSTLDDRTTEICIAYDGACWNLNHKPIRGTTLPFVNDGGAASGCPRHWNCRSVIVPLVKSWRELGIDADEFTPSVRASADGEVAAKMTYQEWLAGKSAEQQAEVLGAGKAELFRAGRISTRDLLDQRGRPLTLKELRAKHGATA